MLRGPITCPLLWRVRSLEKRVKYDPSLCKARKSLNVIFNFKGNKNVLFSGMKKENNILIRHAVYSLDKHQSCHTEQDIL